MKRLVTIVFIFWLLPLGGNCQSLVWEKITNLSRFGGDNITDLYVYDSSRFFCEINSEKYLFNTVRGLFNKPVVYSYNSSGNLSDSIILNDTIENFLSCLDRNRKRIWLHYIIANGLDSRLVLTKVNFRGFVLTRRDFRNEGIFLDSIPISNSKILPSTDGGFYLLASYPRRIGTQNTQLWQVSRWDSLGNRRWVKEYRYTYAFGQPNYAEFLPNGNLFVSGFAGREIMALEIDTGMGWALDRKVLYTHPDSAGWFSGIVKKCRDGYLVEGEDNRSAGANKLFCKVNDSLQVVWGGLSTEFNRFSIPMSDSTLWVSRAGTRQENFHYFHLNKDSVLLHSLLLPGSLPAGSNYPVITGIGHFNNLSAVFAGSIITRTTIGRALYLCKIDSIGTPYNPVYPPVGPVPVATKNRIVEPDLQVFPNPFTHTLRISHKGTMQLLDIHGRKVMAQAVEAGQEINTGSLPRGMYLLRFNSAAGKGYVRKVVKE